MNAPERDAAGATRHSLTADRVAGFALVALALGIAWESARLPIGNLANPGPGFLPLVLAIALAGFGVLLALLDREARRWRELAWPEAWRAAAILGACAFAALALEPLGYRLTTFLIVAFLLGVMERRHWLAVAVAAVVLSLGTHYLFATLLRVPLPRGPWGF